MSLDPPPEEAEPLADAKCPDEGEGYSIDTGTQRVDIVAEAPWEIVVEQQVQTPLHEPVLPEMQDPEAEVIAQGEFYGIERDGYGTLLVYRLPDGSRALRFEGFATAPDTELVVWLSEARRPKTSVEALAAPYREIAPLKSTVGDQNYPIPSDLQLDRIRSVVIWCPVRIAYAAAPIEP